MPELTAIQGTIQDLRYGIRMLLKNPVVTVTSVLSLALGIGANTAIFSIIDAVLLRSLPVRQPSELVLLSAMSRTGVPGSFSHKDFEMIRDGNKVFTGVLASSPWELTLQASNSNEHVQGDLVSSNYFQLLGVHPVLGRTFTDADAARADPLAVISYRFWKQHFGGSSSALSRELTINGTLLEIIGVAPPEFFGETVGKVPDIWIPLTMEPALNRGQSLLHTRNASWLDLMGRLRANVTLGQARASLAVLLSAIQKDMHIDPQSDYLSAIDVQPGAGGFSMLRLKFAQPLHILMGIVGLVLLIACVNVANLLLSRAAGRQREFALRLALGSSRGRLFRQLITESFVLAMIAGVAALALAGAVLRILPALVRGEGESKVSLNLGVLLFTAAISWLAALMFGVFPAMRNAQTDPGPLLKFSSRTVGDGPRKFGASQAFVSAQVALSVVLLITAGLFIHSLQNLRSYNPGFDKQAVVQVQVDASEGGYNGRSGVPYAERVVNRLKSLPGIESASFSGFGFGEGMMRMCCVNIDAHAAGSAEDKTVRVQQVSPGYFTTLGIQLIAGRTFAESDKLGAPEVAVINESMAKYYFGDQSPIGRRFGWIADESRKIEIVGVVRDAKYDNLRERTPRMLYQSFLQNAVSPNFFYVRLSHASSPNTVSSIRGAVKEVDRGVPVIGADTLAGEVDKTLQLERLVAELCTFFASLAVLLAAVGLYGMMMYAVTRRTGEIGVRIALGARSSDIVRMVFRDAAILVCLGLIVGLPVALASTRLVANQLFGLSPSDPATIAAALTTILYTSALAVYIPSRRAASVDAMVVLRDG